MIRPGAATQRPGRSASGRDGRRPPEQLRPLDGHHIEATWRRVGPAQEEVRGRARQTLALGGGDAGPRTAVRGRPPLPDFDEHQRAVGLAHDEVDLAAARMRPARKPIIAPHQRQTLGLQVTAGAVFGLLAPYLRESHCVNPTA